MLFTKLCILGPNPVVPRYAVFASLGIFAVFICIITFFAAWFSLDQEIIRSQEPFTYATSMGMEGRVAETCSRTACSGCYDREGPQMSGHHKPLLSRQPCQTDHMLLFIPH